MRSQKHGGFTLVELIVVITILAILGTIGFISFQGFSRDSRNAKRDSDLLTLSKHIELSTLRGNNLLSFSYTGQEIPNTQIGGITVTGTSYKAGKINWNNLNIPGDNFIDPLTDEEYRIGVSLFPNNAFQLASIYERAGDTVANVKGTYVPRNKEIIYVTSTGNGKILTLINQNDIGKIFQNDRIIGPYIPANTYVQEINGNTIVLSQETLGNTSEIYLASSETEGLIFSYLKNGVVTQNSEYTPYGYGDSNKQTPLVFVSIWDTSLPGKTGPSQIELPLDPSGSHNFEIDWGDGTIGNITSTPATHVYASDGIYTLTMSGTIDGFAYDNSSSAGSSDIEKLTDVLSWGGVKLADNGYQFSNMTASGFSATDSPDLSSVTNMNHMFRNAANFNSSLDFWDTTNVTSMGRMFLGASSFDQDLNNWNVENVQDMSAMFQNAGNFNGDIGAWNVENVQDMSYTFRQSPFNQNIDGWNVGNVENFASTFFYAEDFNQPLNNWNTSSGNTMNSMFYGASIFNYPLDNWDVSSVEDFASMFRRATQFNQNISNWSISGTADSTDFDLETGTGWTLSEKPSF